MMEGQLGGIEREHAVDERLMCSQLAADESMQKGMKQRWRITPEALEVLQQVFELQPCPSAGTRDMLAERIGCTPRQVQVWFQNKRQRAASKAKRKADDIAALPQVAPQANGLHGMALAANAIHGLALAASGACGLPAFAGYSLARHASPAQMGHVPASVSPGTDGQESTMRHNASTDSLADLAKAATRVEPSPMPPPAAEPPSVMMAAQAPAASHAQASSCGMGSLPRADSLASLAMAASRVESFGDLTALAKGVSVAPSTVVSLADLAGAQISRAGSLQDLSVLTRADLC